MQNRIYVAIDLKSFYASVECADRHLNPLTTNLVVADTDRTEKTICLAVSPALKAYGIGGRARLFEVLQKIDDVNRRRLLTAGLAAFRGSSCDAAALASHPEMQVKFLAARPRMARYLEVSTEIYKIYLQYFAPEDMHVYSVDEVFIDITDYIKTYGLRPKALTRRLIAEVLEKTGITATAGIGTNLYLAKVALDIEAKKIQPDADGVRIALLDEIQYRRRLWDHRPLRDFWRIGGGISAKLRQFGIDTMGDLARCSLQAEDALYRQFGKNAELLIDHAWGYEPCTMADIKAYRPANRSLGSGQVLKKPYPAPQARLVAGEMADALALELTEKKLLASEITLTVSYDAENLRHAADYAGEVKEDFYGRPVPKHAHGSEKFPLPAAGRSTLHEAVMRIFDRTVDPRLLIRRLTVTAGSIKDADDDSAHRQQLNFFSAPDLSQQHDGREQALQETAAALRKRFGKNVLFFAADLEEGATTLERGSQIGGHLA